jgi:tetratricopeptide (TPR) repeat protein
LKNWKIQAVIVGAILVLSGIAIFFYLSPGSSAEKIERIGKKADAAVSAKNYIDAEVLLRKGLESYPNDPDLLLKLGNVLEKEGVLDQAREAYLSSAHAKKSAEPEYQAGMVALKLNEQDEAEKLFLDNNKDFPDHVPTLYQLGAIMAKQGKYDEAITYFQKITSLLPSEAEAYNNLGFCYFSMEQPQKAKEMFLKALAINPNFEAAKKSLETVEADLAGKPQQGSSAQKCKDCK